jgi:hypothetical protein
MMTDIVKWLRESAEDPTWVSTIKVPKEWCAKAADEIERLRAEVAALQADAKRIDWIEAEAKRYKIEFALSILGTGFEVGQWQPIRITVKAGGLRAAIDAARAAMEKPE